MHPAKIEKVDRANMEYDLVAVLDCESKFSSKAPSYPWARDAIKESVLANIARFYFVIFYFPFFRVKLGFYTKLLQASNDRVPSESRRVRMEAHRSRLF